MARKTAPEPLTHDAIKLLSSLHDHSGSYHAARREIQIQATEAVKAGVTIEQLAHTLDLEPDQVQELLDQAPDVEGAVAPTLR